MKFGMFFLAEFISTLFMSGFFATIYLGGYRFFGLENLVVGEVAIGNLLAMVVFFVKMFAVYFVFIWIRGTLPRVRIDQMLNINWKFLVPLSLALIFTVAILDKVIIELGVTGDVGRGLIHLASNLIIGFTVLEIIRRRARRQREAQEEARTLPASEEHLPAAAH
jgi:NADH-quinone oxidoreductase subunit H